MRKARFSSKPPRSGRPLDFLPHPSIHAWRAQRSADKGSRLFERSEFTRDPAEREHDRLPVGAAEGSGIAGRTSVAHFLVTQQESGSPAGANSRPAAPAKKPLQALRTNTKASSKARTIYKNSVFCPPAGHLNFIINSKPRLNEEKINAQPRIT